MLCSLVTTSQSSGVRPPLVTGSCQNQTCSQVKVTNLILTAQRPFSGPAGFSLGPHHLSQVHLQFPLIHLYSQTLTGQLLVCQEPRSAGNKFSAPAFPSESFQSGKEKAVTPNNHIVINCDNFWGGREGITEGSDWRMGLERKTFQEATSGGTKEEEE